jgi:hypothetical protein
MAPRPCPATRERRAEKEPPSTPRAACSGMSAASLLPILGRMGGRDYIQVVQRAHTIAHTIAQYSCSERWRDATAARGGEGVMAAGQVVAFGALLRQYRRAAGLAQQALAWRSRPVPPLRPSAPWNGAFGAGPSQHRGHRRSGAISYKLPHAVISRWLLGAGYAPTCSNTASAHGFAMGGPAQRRTGRRRTRYTTPWFATEAGTSCPTSGMRDAISKPASTSVDRLTGTRPVTPGARTTMSRGRAVPGRIGPRTVDGRISSQ